MLSWRQQRTRLRRIGPGGVPAGLSPDLLPLPLPHPGKGQLHPSRAQARCLGVVLDPSFSFTVCQQTPSAPPTKSLQNLNASPHGLCPRWASILPCLDLAAANPCPLPGRPPAVCPWLTPRSRFTGEPESGQGAASSEPPPAAPFSREKQSPPMSLACLPAHQLISPPLPPSPLPSLLCPPPHQPWDLCTCSSCGLVLCSLTYLRDSPPSFRSMFSPQLLREAFPGRLWKTASSSPTPGCPCLSQAGFVSPAPHFVTGRVYFACLSLSLLTHLTYWSWSSPEQGFCLICLCRDNLFHCPK